jgi:hypothetical protein
VCAFPNHLAVADVNLDGKLDVLAPCNGSGKVTILLNTGGTNFSQTSVNTTFAPDGIAVGDINRDGKPDFAVGTTNGTSLRVFLNTSK